MRFTSVLALSASLLTLGYAADPLAFTSWPTDIQAGKPVTLTWTGAASNQPVTLTLRKGNAGDLDDVETITNQAKDGTFTWTPGDNVKEGDSYAFQVSQGDQHNYSGLLKAGAGVPNQSSQATSDATQTGTATTASTTATTASTATTGTTTATQSTSTSSKPLIGSSAGSVTPSSTPSSTIVTSALTAGPFMTSTAVINGKQASETAIMQSGDASVPEYSLKVVLGALAGVLYLAH
ncbi:uncharacterized protein N7459_002255 [Penicillium hispanicum]|uniref:uncharacterized protein n=1 Tax=Penicillium hispanicum TaxID=1080232 RepID=UPI002540F067|nr:uncharacterized protein N7459_002255 [Penicillium hispanicum]KAJ5591886.1 hypothetical protein N7459_002255 [Penicillium hispanicum]